MPPDAICPFHTAGANPGPVASKMMAQAIGSNLDHKLKITKVENDLKGKGACPHCPQLEKKKVGTVHYACMQLKKGAKNGQTDKMVWR